MFNCLEKIARSKHPATPVLKCRISKSLEPQAIGHSVFEMQCFFLNDVSSASAHDFCLVLAKSGQLDYSKQRR